jgi:hypothetical protein
LLTVLRIQTGVPLRQVLRQAEKEIPSVCAWCFLFVFNADRMHSKWMDSILSASFHAIIASRPT